MSATGIAPSVVVNVNGPWFTPGAVFAYGHEMSNVIHLAQAVGDGVHLDADEILENNKGVFRSLVLCGIGVDGELVVAATDSSAESVFLLERAKNMIVTCEVERT